MRALFVSPLPFVGTTATGIAAPIAGSVDFLNDDRPGLVWRGATNGAVMIDLGPDPVEYNTVAVIGSNLRASDTVRVQTGSAPDTMDGYDSTAKSAWQGKKPKQLTAKSVLKLPATRAERFVKITFAAPNHPNGYVQFQRLVIGKAVSTYGIEFGAKLNFEDRSVITTGPGFTTTDRYDVLPAWDISTTGITDEEWREQWAPLLLEAGSSAGILFVRDEKAPATWQTDAVFGRISSKAYGEAKAYNWWVFAGTILAFAP
ncbi:MULTISPECIES: hypothetical protein [Sphingomonas]|uniref:hypothetical protein n=1 Tax=Sphingomonas TaxID=13687 RepID=UPI000F7E8CEE|nr:hypothetical protein [Sphingomonas sp. ABOLF]RSV14646.1 hypothetical protein CA235_11240 [Sphingomonas sp. ABOLF]GLK19248.1 hypothetical protein GCM10017606_00740 [Microbacterium terregens]